MLAQKRQRQSARNLSEGSPRQTRSGGIWLSAGTAANGRTAARRSGAARQRQRDLVHMARTRARRRALGRRARPDRARSDADGSRARAHLPARARPAARGPVSNRRRCYAETATRARRIRTQPRLCEDLHMGHRRVEPRRRGGAVRLCSARRRATQQPAPRLLQSPHSRGDAELGERRPLCGGGVPSGHGTNRRDEKCQSAGR